MSGFGVAAASSWGLGAAILSGDPPSACGFDPSSPFGFSWGLAKVVVPPAPAFAGGLALS